MPSDPASAPWSALEPAQMPQKWMLAFEAIAARATQPISTQALLRTVWPDYPAAGSQLYLSKIINSIRATIGQYSVVGSLADGFQLGRLDRRPVPVRAPRTHRHYVERSPFTPPPRALDDTHDRLLRAQEWAQSQRPSARPVASPEGHNVVSLYTGGTL